MTAANFNKSIVVICIVAIIVGLCLFNPFPLYFLNDDLVHIPLAKDGALFQHKSFRPVCDLSVALDYWLWGKNAYGYHITNVVLHIANSILVFWFSKVLFRKFELENVVVLSVLTATLFFIYAFHSETILWILGRSASLGCLFFIPSMVFYLRRNDNGSFFFLSLLFFALGLMTYESVWIFPIVAACISIATPGKKKKERVYVLSVLALFLIYLFIRKQTIGEVVGNYEAASFFGWNIKTLILNFVRLFSRAMLPPMMNTAYFIDVAIVVVAVAGLIVVVYRRKLGFPSLLVGLLFMVSFVPYLSLGIDTHTVEGERYLYLPTLFVALLLTTTIFKVINGFVGRIFVIALLFSFHLFFLYRSANYYTSASSISKTILTELNKLNNKKRLFVDSLPQSVRGALVFRTGFEDGVNWLKKPGSVDSVFVVSIKMNNNNWSKALDVTYPTSYNTGSFSSLFIKDSTFKQNYFQKQVEPLHFNPSTDAWFIYKDDHLEVIK
jgi:hypothetical protein